MGKTDYLEEALLNHVFGTVTTDIYNQPTVYVGLFTTTPTADDGTGGVEVATGAYQRVAMVHDGVSNTMGAASGGLMTSANTVTFPTATADWGTITGAGFWDSISGGTNMLYFQALTGGTQTVNNGDTARFSAGSIAVTDD